MTSVERRLLIAVERLGRALGSSRQAVACAHDLSLLQLLVVELAAAHPKSRVGAIATELGVSQPTVSDAITSLVNKNIVERVQDPTDRRASMVSLTVQGLRTWHDISRQLDPLHVGEHTISRDDNAVALRVLLHEIRRLQRIGVVSVDRSCLSCDHYRGPPGTTAEHCALLDTPLGPHDLRVDCQDHSTL